jgi:DeoR/GlpR family transcriptional regulator of sugar metabolism
MQVLRKHAIDIAHKSPQRRFVVKVPLHVIKARRERLAQMIVQHHYLPVRELCKTLGVSEATLRRDLAALHGEKRITRTYGGALSEFNDRFPSFRARRSRGGKSKARIARAALSFFKPGGTYFLDSGTTVFSIAEAFAAVPVTPVKIVTSNIPVAELLAAIPEVEVFLLAGQLLHLQSVLLGEMARKSLVFWSFDGAFLSAEGMNAEGIWNSQAAIVEQQTVLLERTKRAIFCLDGAKLDKQAPIFLCGWDRVDVLLTDATQEVLRKAGISLPEERCFSTSGTAESPTVFDAMSAKSTEDNSSLPVHIL